MRMCKPRSVHCEALIRRQPAGLSSSSANLHNSPGVTVRCGESRIGNRA